MTTEKGVRDPWRVCDPLTGCLCPSNGVSVHLWDVCTFSVGVCDSRGVCDPLGVSVTPGVSVTLWGACDPLGVSVTLWGVCDPLAVCVALWGVCDP